MRPLLADAGNGVSGRASEAKRALQRLSIRMVARYLRSSPFVAARWRLVEYFLPLLRDVGSEMGAHVIRTRHGFLLNVDLGEWIGQHIYLTGDYERPTTKLIRSLVREGDTVVDVGANIGFFALLASRLVGESGKVLAFEPVSSTCADLKANLALNGASNVVVHERALSNVGGTVMINEGPRRNKGLSSIRPIKEASAQQCVAVSPFDAIEGKPDHIRLVKIDVEGAEQLVLEGMMSTLRRHRPHMIVELTDSFLGNFGHSASSVCKLLEPLGYRAYEIAENGPAALPGSPALWPRQFNAFFSPT